MEWNGCKSNRSFRFVTLALSMRKALASIAHQKGRKIRTFLRDYAIRKTDVLTSVLVAVQNSQKSKVLSCHQVAFLSQRISDKICHFSRWRHQSLSDNVMCQTTRDVTPLLSCSQMRIFWRCCFGLSLNYISRESPKSRSLLASRTIECKSFLTTSIPCDVTRFGTRDVIRYILEECH